MHELNRKDFLKVAGLSSAAVAAPGLALTKHLIDESGQLTFRAAAGLPQRPFPTYATQVVEGRVDLAHGTGLVTSRVLAGPPDDTGLIGLPGLSRLIRITAVDRNAQELRLNGVIEDRSQLRTGESPHVEIRIDHDRGTVRAPFLGRQLDHGLTLTKT